MNNLAIREVPSGVYPPPSEIGTLGAFFQSPTESNELGRSEGRLIVELVGVLDKQLLAAIDARSVPEFDSVRDRVLPRYVRGLRALYDTVVNLISPEMVQRLSIKVMSQLADDLEKQREIRFANEVTDQAIFTLWTIGKIGVLEREIIRAGDVKGDKRKTDFQLMYEYYSTSLWSQFHLDMLFAAIKFDRPIRAPITAPICNGLRASVNAYVIMKDALALRTAVTEPIADAPALPWDEEDEQLLSSSMRHRNDDPAER